MHHVFHFHLGGSFSHGNINELHAIEEAIELLAAFSRTTASTAGEAPIVPGS